MTCTLYIHGQRTPYFTCTFATADYSASVGTCLPRSAKIKYLHLQLDPRLILGKKDSAEHWNAKSMIIEQHALCSGPQPSDTRDPFLKPLAHSRGSDTTRIFSLTLPLIICFSDKKLYSSVQFSEDIAP